jgi:hypothetical protein
MEILHKRHDWHFILSFQFQDILPWYHDSASSTASLSTSEFGAAQSKLGSKIGQQGHLRVGVRVLNLVPWTKESIS